MASEVSKPPNMDRRWGGDKMGRRRRRRKGRVQWVCFLLDTLEVMTVGVVNVF